MNSYTEIRLKSNRLDICRCCLEEDGVTDIFLPIYSLEKETYEEMLQKTCNVQLSSHLTDSKSLICGQCINRLREAHTFKLLVPQSDKTLSEYLQTLHSSEDCRSGHEVRETKMEDTGGTLDSQECDDDGKQWSQIC